MKWCTPAKWWDGIPKRLINCCYIMAFNSNSKEPNRGIDERHYLLQGTHHENNGKLKLLMVSILLDVCNESLYFTFLCHSFRVAELEVYPDNSITNPRVSI